MFARGCAPQSIRTRRVGRLDYRESSFLLNPLTPPEVREGQVSVVIAPDAGAMRSARERGDAVILEGTSDAQAVESLAAHADTPVRVAA